MNQTLTVGNIVRIRHNMGMKSLYTPQWCEGWTGRVVRLNPLSVTIEFDVEEPNRPTVRRRIDYDDIQMIKSVANSMNS